jgi:predicted RND superfamily exporter protein
VLLLGYLLLHFRSVVAVAFNLLPVAAGLVWTYGIVGAVYGSVNLLTAFAGAILGGLSVEHGIHLLGRYESLRAAGESSERATGEAFSHTGSAALIAALVAALTFLSLAVSDFRVFREFGFIAAFGMVVAIAAYLLVLPALIGIASRLGWRPTSAWLRTNRASRLAHWLQRPRFRQSVVAVTVVALGAALWNARNARFDFDISALEDSSMPSFVFDKTTNRLLGYSQTPVVVLTPDAQSERAVVDELNRRKRQRGAASGVDFVAALDDLVPQQQVDKQQVLASMAEVLGRVKRDGLPPETRGRFDQLARMVAAKPFTRADLPVGVRRQFLGIDEGQTGFVLVFPSISLSDGARVRDFAREVRSIELPGGGRLSAAGEAMMLADIIDMVAREMPLIFATALVSIVLAMALTLGSLKLALLCMSPTLVSIFALFGLVPACGLTFNYLNVIVLTVLIGVTVDAGVHMVSRLTTPGEDFVAVYGETGRAIAGGILTSALGFGAMWLADHPGLQSVGQLANLGFATNLVMMLLVFPAVALPFLRRRRPDPEPVAAPAEGSGSEGQRFGVRAGGQGGR